MSSGGRRLYDRNACQTPGEIENEAIEEKEAEKAKIPGPDIPHPVLDAECIITYDQHADEKDCG
jgi:hypothetical protein